MKHLARIRIQTVVLFVPVFFCLSGRAYAQSPLSPCSSVVEVDYSTATTNADILSGITAFQDGRLGDAKLSFQTATENKDSRAEAYYWLARLSMNPAIDEPAAASRYLRQALDIDPANATFIEERLKQLSSGDYFFSGTWGDKLYWAEKLIAIDDRSAFAHEQKGVEYAGQYYSYAALLKTNFNNVLANMTSVSRERTQYHLERALYLDPCLRSVYNTILRFYFNHRQFDEAYQIAHQMQESYPNDDETWLFSGMASYFGGLLEEADTSFEKAFQLMSDDDRWSFLQYTYFLAEEDRLEYARNPDLLTSYWESKRTRYMSSVNERLLAHYARLVYADMFFPYWREYADDEWRITPGEMILRYGLPLGEITRIDSYDYLSRYLTLAFRHGSFRFTDYTRNGEYFIIGKSLTLARDQIHRTPETYSYEGRKIDFPYLVTVFRSPEPPGVEIVGTQKAEILISYGIPIASESADSTNGVAIPREIGRNELDQLYIRFGSFLIDLNNQVADEWTQTIYGLPESGILITSGGRLWASTQNLSALPGEYNLSVEFETLSKTIIGATPSRVSIAPFAGDSLSLSDLLLAYSIEELGEQEISTPNSVVRNGLLIEPAPWAVFSPRQPIYVYFEMYTLALNAGNASQAEIEIALIPQEDTGGVAAFFQRILGGEEPAGVAVRSTYTGSNRNDSQYVILDASEQSEGEYELVVRVRDLNTGALRTSHRTLILEEPE